MVCWRLLAGPSSSWRERRNCALPQYARGAVNIKARGAHAGEHNAWHDAKSNTSSEQLVSRVNKLGSLPSMECTVFACRPTTWWKVAGLGAVVAWIGCSSNSVCHLVQLLYMHGPRALLFHLRNAHKLRSCCFCGKLILPQEVAYTGGRLNEVTTCARCRGMCDHELVLHCEVQPLVVDTAPFGQARCAGQALLIAFDVYGPRPCLGRCPRSRFASCSWRSYREVGNAAVCFGAGLQMQLKCLGSMPKRPIVGLLAAISEQWFITDFACTIAGVPLIIMHRSTDAKVLAHILDQTSCCILVASKHLKQIVQQASIACKKVPTVIWINDSEDSYCRPFEHLPETDSLVCERSWISVLQQGSVAPLQQAPARDPKSLIKLLPSSGSTGLPKLISVTECGLFKPGTACNLQSAVDVVVYAYEAIRQSHDVLMQGGQIGVFSGSLDRILDDARALRPTVFAAPPTFWNGLHAEFEDEVVQEQAGGKPEPTARNDVLQAWLNRPPLGNRIVALISTGAAPQHHVQRWLTRIFGKMVLDCYGCTETGRLASNGSVSSSAELRLRDLPDMGYLTSDRPPRGEILARTPEMTGYFNLEGLKSDGTIAADGDSEDWIVLGGVRYFCTGDVGELVSPANIRVIDRCKHHFKLAQGIYVAPDPVESCLLQSPFVSQIFVWGCGSMQSVAAVAVPSSQAFLKLGLDPSDRGWELQHLVLRSFSEVKGLRPWEVPTKVLLENRFDERFQLGAGKLSRAALIRHYAPRLAGKEGIDLDIPPSRRPNGSDMTLCDGLRQILQSLCQKTTFLPGDSVAALGLDSLGVARLSARISRHFGTEVPPGMLFSIDTLADLERVALCGPQTVRNVLAKRAVVNWSADADAAFQALLASLRPAAGPKGALQAVLLTGATGFLGAFVAARLAGQARPVICLVRAADQATAERRLLKSLRFYQVAADVASIQVLPTAGLELHDLGLSKEAADMVSTSTSVIVHCAAQVSGVCTYSALHSPNVLGTQQVVALALRSHARLVHVSTLGFLPDGHAEVREVSPDHLLHRSGYAQSKWVAEQLVWKAVRHGLDAVVLRPGTVWGDAGTGASNPKDALGLLALGLTRLGCISLDARSPLPPGFNLVHVNYVADAIVATLEANVPANFNPIHLCALSCIPMTMVCQWIQSAGYSLEEMSTNRFCGRVLQVDEEHPLFTLRSQLGQPRSGMQQSLPVVRCGHESILNIKSPRKVSQEGFLRGLSFLSSLMG
ncbi:unnamed protein product [Effrenium voratum]|nr:unnamed protein product [Effrenium voratum]